MAKREKAPRRNTRKGEALAYFNKVVLTYEGEDCLLWPFGKSSTGYGQLWDGERFRIVSRMVCERMHGAPPSPSYEAAHSCGQGHLGCVTRKHLSWKTPQENRADKIVHGTHLRGSKCGAAKLSEADVRKIIALKGTMFQREIAARFGVARNTVSVIHSGKNWGWLS